MPLFCSGCIQQMTTVLRIQTWPPNFMPPSRREIERRVQDARRSVCLVTLRGKHDDDYEQTLEGNGLGTHAERALPQSCDQPSRVHCAGY